MWRYSQSTGELSRDGTHVGVGYSGAAGVWKNNPDMEQVPQHGPIPRGSYSIGAAFTDPHKGPLTMRLVPDMHNAEFGRSGFMIHADSIGHPGCASEGCIILYHPLREKIAASPDRQLEVVA